MVTTTRKSQAQQTNFAEDLADLNRALGTVRRVVRQLSPDRLAGDQAMTLAEVLAGFEPVVASGVALLTPAVIETGVYAKFGFASAQDWLAAATGTSAGAAKGRLACAERAASVPELGAALHEGILSSPQLGLLAQTEAAASGSAAELLGMIGDQASHQELSEQASRMKAAARSREVEHQRRDRVHRTRHLRWSQDPEGGIRGEFSCDEVQWARIAPTLEAAALARWKAAGSDGSTEGESMAAHRMDALFDLLTGSGGGPRAQVLVIIDAEALRRGTTATGEICEIEGIGPVPVDAAVELLGEASLQYVVKEARDIKSVTKSSRSLAQKTAAALLVRDRTCVVPGCGKQMGLQADHCRIDFADGGPTTYDNLARLCPSHHAMKSHGGWMLSGSAGAWKWIPPSRPPTEGRISRERRLAAAKANRNTPRQT